jgi:hypothetical protein
MANGVGGLQKCDFLLRENVWKNILPYISCANWHVVLLLFRPLGPVAPPGCVRRTPHLPEVWDMGFH